MSSVFFPPLNDGNVKRSTVSDLERVKFIPSSHNSRFFDRDTPVLSCLSAPEAVSCTECRKNLWLNLPARLRWSFLALARFAPISFCARVDGQGSDFWASRSPTDWRWASW